MSAALTTIRRCVQLPIGAAAIGVGIAAMINAHAGLLPWDVWHVALSAWAHTWGAQVTVGGGVIATAALALIVSILLGEPVRLQTTPGVLVGLAVPGVATDVALAVLPGTDGTAARIAYLACGAVVFAAGSALMVGSGLGAGPRDRVMQALVRRGLSVRRARIGLDVSALIAGMLLAGPVVAVQTRQVWIGTVVVAVVVGPLVAWILPRVTVSSGTSKSSSGRRSDRQGRLPGRHRAPRRRWFGSRKAARSGSGAAARGIVAASLLATAGCAAIPSNPFASTPAPDPAPVALTVRVLGQIPQPTTDEFVEGLAVLSNNRLLEDTGAADGPSRLRILDAATGRVEHEAVVDGGVFAEGLTVVPNCGGQPVIWMLTWKDQLALRYSTDLVPLGRTSISGGDGQGWGLTYDGRELVSSDGTATLTRRDPCTAAPIGAFTVTAAGKPSIGLNELDWDGTFLWANQFPTGPGLLNPVNTGTSLFAIDPYTGRVAETADLAELQRTEHPDDGDPDAVPNGIAAARDGTYWLTGKRWQHLLHVSLTPAAAPTSSTSTVGEQGRSR